MIEVLWHQDGVGELAEAADTLILSDEQGHVVALPAEDWAEMVAAWLNRAQWAGLP